ncbi:hypothetical protein [Oligoflexus tunisiensis]|uniref:hypothetical protein n=1 Tax=Oligoflexus tunisiensis TaxID=708132 RepID=UPI00114C9694|nr:hypothetical protein [Oligoflexus tunisiensis]
MRKHLTWFLIVAPLLGMSLINIGKVVLASLMTSHPQDFGFEMIGLSAFMTFLGFSPLRTQRNAWLGMRTPWTSVLLRFHFSIPGAYTRIRDSFQLVRVAVCTQYFILFRA